MFAQPVAFVLFLICIHAEANRAPFDLAEAEQELVGGYHTEYSSMRFALFFLSEYAGMITTSAVCVALFFGGWQPAVGGQAPASATVSGRERDRGLNHPAVTTYWLANVVRFGVFFTKTIGIIFVFMWVRWSLPRFRFDQLMLIAWRALIPMSLALVVATAVVQYFVPTDLFLSGWAALLLLGANVAVVAASLVLARVLPTPRPTNRRMAVAGSRYGLTPHPAALN